VADRRGLVAVPGMRRRLALLAAVGLLFATSRGAAAEDGGVSPDAFRKQVADGKASVRMRAYESAAASSDPKTIDLVLEALPKEVGRAETIAKEQVTRGKDLEGVLGEIEKNNATTPQSAREIDEYNRRSRKLESRRDALNDRLADLAGESTQEAAVVQNALGALGAVIGRLPQAAQAAALGRIETDWTGPKAPPEARLRFVDLLGSTSGEESLRRLKAVTIDETLEPTLRGVALQYRVGRGDLSSLGDAILLLQGASWPVVAAAVDAIRQWHRRDGIEPLIAFLGRGDIGVLREKAHRALRSLTGQKHGPYQGPWQDWWKSASATFVMPPKPADAAELAPANEGTGFFGIVTYSRRILYVVDVSGSMLEPAHPEAAGDRGKERRIDAARTNLLGSIDMLSEGGEKGDARKAVFNLVFFNHKVTTYQAGAVVADKIAKDRAKQFATRVEPSGGTNIYDALETAFALANPPGQTGRTEPVFDTIMFLTDGKPTAGKVQKPDRILAAVADWNRGLHVTIHVVGLGESDPVFLKALAEHNDGTFVQR
jgi:hypothetical protein